MLSGSTDPAPIKDAPNDVVTASTQIEQTYYGRPVIKAAHWRWLVINYFFVAALTGASAAIATLAELYSKDRMLARVARYLALATAVPAPILLVLDLGRPERAFYMFRILKLRSPMSLGAWALLIHGLSAGALGGLQLLADLTRPNVLGKLRRGMGVVTMPISLFVGGYTGVLLAATNVPLWARNYLLIGPTFLTSAFSSSLSAISLLLRIFGDKHPETERGLARAETICLAAELGLLVASIRRLGPSGKPLTSGRWGRLFWSGTFAGGVVIPLALHLSGPLRGKQTAPQSQIVAAIMALLGGYILRMLMIFAGKDSANRPEDYFEYTRGTGNNNV